MWRRHSDFLRAVRTKRCNHAHLVGSQLALTLMVALSILSVRSTVASQGTAAAEPQTVGTEVLTNDDIIKLVRAGFSDPVIIAKIKHSRTNLDTRSDTLIELKRLGVSDPVLEAMAEAGGTVNHAVPDPNDPFSSHDPGIYLMQMGRRGKHMIQLEPAAYSQVKLGGTPHVGLPVPGAVLKSKWKAILRGERAQLRIVDAKPVFYFYFQRALASAGATPDGQAPAAPSTRGGFPVAPTGPNQFTLARFEIRDGQRELVIGEMGALGTSMGVSPKEAIEFDFERLAPGIYKVAPRSDVPPGEYCFLYLPTSAASANQLFDFGIITAQ